jgi:multiple sugar transport system ATP-binding protein
MTSVRYDHATRIYPGTDVAAVDSLDVEIGDGELLVLVGPSGSGKSTALRMLAGLEPLDTGAIYIGDRDVSNVRPRDRDIAMVFQNYALYPQLTVAENMGFALKQQGVKKEERISRVRETARILDLEPYLDRKPKHLSGGQRQRVAMGRAIVRQPAVYLMDEPLSNLDAKLRVQTRTEVVELQARLGVTTVYVTHDQVEAMTMGHRVAVLKGGVLQQCDTPRTLYHEPINLFVAGFIGSPAMNLVDVGEERPLALGGSTIALAPPGEAALAEAPGAITVGFRPEALRVGDGPLRAQIRTVEDLGSEVFVHVYLEHRGESLPLVSKMFPPFAGEPGDSIGLQITGATHLFAADGSRVVSTTATLHGTSESAAVTADASTSTP